MLPRKARFQASGHPGPAPRLGGLAERMTGVRGERNPRPRRDGDVIEMEEPPKGEREQELKVPNISASTLKAISLATSDQPAGPEGWRRAALGSGA
jgi:hypothetical protein